ncbi:hypothetical protein ITP53_36430 [Nonomuraea sp. K274]|uniref:Uncharacterized protein n=1 Tax=Nonomuraea cypriaca TaxID=1187855 RepID=A0A931F0P5_9ACTN|nr:hypothetical protein [Nonomuraea cypriaca]MBF8191104.1 hypothetical protein [Nonomuraea cypriaca]
MSHFPDTAAPGRLRRLALTVVPPLLLLIVPMALVGVYGGRLPDRAYVESWATLPQYAPTWEGWLSGRRFSLVWFEVALVVPFVYYWRLPQLQRAMVIFSFVVGVYMSVSAALWLMLLVDAQGTLTRPAWHVAVEIAAAVAAAGLGYLAAGPTPSPPEVTATPPPHTLTMALGPSQRVLFVTSAWSGRRLLVAAAFGTAAVLSLSVGSHAWIGTLMLALMAIFEAAQARTRLQIDGSGITVLASWLPILRRTVPYSSVRFAEARSEPLPGRYRLGDSASGWGMVSGKGPVLALSLSDDRWFVYSTREAETAAALVNGWLIRQRQGETA